MVLCTVFGLIVFVTPNLAEQMCTISDRLKGVEKDKILPGSQIAILTMPGIMACSRACLYRRRCKSFNFNAETGECQLNSQTADSAAATLNKKTNFVFSDISHWPERLAGVCADHTCPLNCICDPINDTHYVCNITGCLDIHTVVNGQLNETQNAEEIPTGTVLDYTCDPGYMPQGELVCQGDGTWSSALCVSISSCSMVKQYQSDSEDGEYWLRLNNFDNYTTKIYCHNMSTSSPREFLTLPNLNYGIYPRVMNEHCTEETALRYACKGEGGEIWFSKISVNITTMEVVKDDRTYANISGSEEMLFYGSAWDCYTSHLNKALKCGTKGRFSIDLRGTGWRVSEDQQWEAYGFEAMIESIDRQMNGTVINLRCGGYGGGCRPTGGLSITLVPRGLAN